MIKILALLLCSVALIYSAEPNPPPVLLCEGIAFCVNCTHYWKCAGTNDNFQWSLNQCIGKNMCAFGDCSGTVCEFEFMGNSGSSGSSGSSKRDVKDGKKDDKKNVGPTSSGMNVEGKNESDVSKNQTSEEDEDMMDDFFEKGKKGDDMREEFFRLRHGKGRQGERMRDEDGLRDEGLRGQGLRDQDLGDQDLRDINHHTAMGDRMRLREEIRLLRLLRLEEEISDVCHKVCRRGRSRDRDFF